MPIRPLSDELQKIAAKELNEVPERRQTDIQHIREWLQKQQHIKARLDDQWLLLFLRSCRFSLERTKEKLGHFYNMRRIVPECFTNRDPFLPEIQNIFNARAVILLPFNKGAMEPRVMLLRGDRLNPNEHPVSVLLKFSLMVADALHLDEDDFVINGMYGIFDWNNSNYGYLTQLTPTLLKKYLFCASTAYPTRLKTHLIINATTMVMEMYKLYDHFMNTNSRNFLEVRGKTDQPYNFIHRSILPSDLGGEAPTFDELADELKRKVESHRDWFLEDAQFGIDGTKPDDKCELEETLFGIDGSFKKLEID